MVVREKERRGGRGALYVGEARDVPEYVVFATLAGEQRAILVRMPLARDFEGRCG